MSSDSLSCYHTEIQIGTHHRLHFRRPLISLISAAGFWKYNTEVSIPLEPFHSKMLNLVPKSVGKDIFSSYNNQPAGKLLPYSATEKLIDAKGQRISLETLHKAMALTHRKSARICQQSSLGSGISAWECS